MLLMSARLDDMSPSGNTCLGLRKSCCFLEVFFQGFRIFHVFFLRWICVRDGFWMFVKDSVLFVEIFTLTFEALQNTESM